MSYISDIDMIAQEFSVFTTLSEELVMNAANPSELIEKVTKEADEKASEVARAKVTCIASGSYSDDQKQFTVIQRRYRVG